MKKSFGIVLKKNTHKNSFVLLDDALGKITATSTHTSLCTGAALFYVPERLYAVYRIQQVELLYVPFALAREDVLFLHHVLELCLVLMPEGEPAQMVLAYILFLYKNPELLTMRVQKKIFLSKLFSMCGFYPPSVKIRAPYFSKLPAESLDTLLAEPLDLKVEKELDDWLIQCIGAYPQMSNLKTMHFLTRNRAV